MPLYIAIPLLAVFTAFAFRREIAEWRRERQRRAARPAQVAEWNRRHEAENPDVSPLTQEEIEGHRAWWASLALPAVELLPAPKRPVAAGGTRIGGPVWLPEGEAWPADPQGCPLEFVAQVDFGELPPLPDFPTTGLLQFFVGRDDRFGADLDDPARGTARVFWRPDGIEGGRLLPPPVVTAEDSHPWQRPAVREAGLSLTGRAAVHRAGGSDWRIEERLKGQHRRPGIEELDDLLDDDRGLPPQLHHVGGHPVFTQYDFRGPGQCDDYDRTLLRLTSDRNLIWGDCGEAVFLVRRDDLLKRDFSSVIFYWDCT
jgi:uncharacterized protein YwqG